MIYEITTHLQCFRLKENYIHVYSDFQGENSFVRDVVCEILNLQEMVDVIIIGKSIEGRVSMDARATEDDNHDDEMVKHAWRGISTK